jgi:small GTP-binding protein
MSLPIAIIKVVVIGDCGVGMTQLTLRFTKNSFCEGHMPTTGVDFAMKDLDIDAQTSRIQIWDTARQERDREITTSSFHRACGALVADDVASPGSFASLPGWIDLLTKSNGSIPIVIVAAKDDLSHAVDDQEAEEFAERRGVPLFYTSVRTGANIGELFTALASLICTQAHLQNEVAPTLAKKRHEKCC